eukprot:TRINITY_DN25013_c0_g1_i1.p1 TRINITY_DN25013_c0_g1~~TRINITY_DN25013_c0_g1_i1.p1  ORF type:complete len:469 (+),score=61.84 TRINITY_DN25013_c0_g1_i1:71-1477(+)
MSGNQKSCSIYVFNRWFTLFGGLCMTSIAGTPVAVSVYLPYLKEVLGLSLTQKSFVATACNLMMSLTVIPGIFFDRFGPRPTAVMSGLLLFGGYFGLYLCVEKTLPSHYLLVSTFTGLVGLGSGACFTSAITPNIHNFPNHSGKVVGLVASLFGLSGAIFTMIYKYGFEPNVPKFLLFSAILLSSIGVFCGGIFINYVPKPKSRANTPNIPSESPNETTPLYNPNWEEQEEMRREIMAVHMAEEEKQFNPLEMLRTPNFYYFFVLFTVGPGAQFCLMNNIDSVVASHGGSDSNPYVITFAVANFVGTIASGTLGDVLEKFVNRPTLFTISVGLVGLTYVYLAFSNLSMMYGGVVLLGLEMGMLWALAPSISHDLWGSKHWGFNYGLANLGPALGSYLFATLLTSKMLEKFTPKGIDTCIGQKCYEDSFLIMAGCCGFGALLGILLSLGTRRQYRSKLIKKDTLDRLVN